MNTLLGSRMLCPILIHEGPPGCLARLYTTTTQSIYVGKSICSKKLFRNGLTVPKTVEQCQKDPNPYPHTLKRTIPYLNTLNRTIPYLNTLNPLLRLANSSRQPIRIEHYVTRELLARVEAPSRLSAQSRLAIAYLNT